MIFVYLGLLFVVLKIIDLALILTLAYYTSWWMTLLIVLATCFTGAWLLRRQSWAVWRRVGDELAAGRMPGDALFDGLLIFVAGILLVTPGVITDVVAMLFLIPATRRPIKAAIMRYLRWRYRFLNWGAGGPPGSARSEVLEARVIRREESK